MAELSQALSNSSPSEDVATQQPRSTEQTREQNIARVRAMADQVRTESGLPSSSSETGTYQPMLFESLPIKSVSEAKFEDGVTQCLISQEPLSLKDPNQEVVGMMPPKGKDGKVHGDPVFYDLAQLNTWLLLSQTDPLTRSPLGPKEFQERAFRMESPGRGAS